MERLLLGPHVVEVDFFGHLQLFPHTLPLPLLARLGSESGDMSNGLFAGYATTKDRSVTWTTHALGTIRLLFGVYWMNFWKGGK